MRDANLQDYDWLYANTEYMHDGLKCARAYMGEISARCPGSFLDFGCGRGQLVRWINENTTGNAVGYDPATNPMALTRLYDYTLAFDVMEHIPESNVGGILKTICACSSLGFMLTISNASDVVPIRGEEVELHVTRRDPIWWEERIRPLAPSMSIRRDTFSIDRFGFIVDFT